MSTFPPERSMPPMFVCHECQAYFLDESALGRHLIGHNMLRASKLGQPTQVWTAPVPPMQPTAYVPPPVTLKPPASIAPVPVRNVDHGQVHGVVVHYDEQKGYGFISRTAPDAPDDQVYFHISACNIQTPKPTRGEEVNFVEKQGPKGAVAKSLMRVAVNATKNPRIALTDASVPRQSDRSNEPQVPGIIIKYEVLGGFGTIAKLNGSSNSDVYFKIISCDIRRPPPTVGERVMLVEAVGPKGPTASVVRRVSIEPGAAKEEHEQFKAKSKGKDRAKKAAIQGKKKSAAQGKSSLSQDALITALTRAMNMVTNSSKVDATSNGEVKAPVQPADSQASVDAVPLRVDQYESMIQVLSDPENSEIYLPSALAMLRRTRPAEATTVAEAQTTTQRILLLTLLEDEMNGVRLNDLTTEWENDGARELNFGYVAPPSPPAATRRQPAAARPPTPVPEPPRTMQCEICMDEHPIEDIFQVSGCHHPYCRESIRKYILGRIEQQDVTPKCPHDGCATELSDAELIQVLTIEEQQEYYDTCMSLATSSIPDLHRCLEAGCRGVVVLSPHDPRFVCPLCQAERCVQCNTRNWHDELTCEQYRQREQDSQLHPEQMRELYRNRVVYQCQSCGYGPIEHFNCANLQTHHGEAVGNGRINNTCQRCGWFSADISDWPRWNGQLPT